MPIASNLPGLLEAIRRAVATPPGNPDRGPGLGGSVAVDRKRPDHYAKRAKAEGYAARSVYKLDEIERKVGVLQRARRVIDLGCHPGSWSKLVRERSPKAVLVGVDLQPTPSYPGTFVEGSIAEVAPERLRELLGGPADVVLSDMAPSTTGARLKDHVDQIELVQKAWEIAQAILGPGGSVVFKVFDGEDANALVDAIRPHFGTVRRIRPEATRKDSREFFLVGTAFRS
jgi:23S rRNA (uridine2552-2'-O)-methyltransferase